MFWVVAFPVLMALFFGAIFSGAGGESAVFMKVGLATDNSSPAAIAFYRELARIDAIDDQYLSADSERRSVARGRLTAYVFYKDTSLSLMDLFGSSDGPTVEVGIDPSRTAERGYLQGMISQAHFARLQQMMIDPSQWRGPLDRHLGVVDTASGLSEEQRGLLTGFFAHLRDFMGTIDTSSGFTQADVQQHAPLANVDIEFKEVALARLGPRSSWEITFPQSLQ